MRLHKFDSIDKFWDKTSPINYRSSIESTNLEKYRQLRLFQSAIGMGTHSFLQMTDKYSSAEFKTDRIVCLDFEDLHLFAEVIDDTVVNDRCWVRPLALARANPESFNLEFLHDLRDAAQLILPIHLFRDALDTEVIPLISELFHPTQDSTRSTNNRKILHQFIADLYHPH